MIKVDDEPLILPVPLCASSLHSFWSQYQASDSPIPTRWSQYGPKIRSWWRDLLISFQPDPPRRYPEFLYRLGVMKKVKSELTPTQALCLGLSNAVTPHKRQSPDDKMVDVLKLGKKRSRNRSLVHRLSGGMFFVKLSNLLYPRRPKRLTNCDKYDTIAEEL